MRLRLLITAVALVAFAGLGTMTARAVGSCATGKVCCAEVHSCCDAQESSCCDTPTTIAYGKQWTIANFVDAVLVNRTLVSGQVLIVHDDEKMANGEPCTTFYRFDPASGPKEELVSFHCIPRKTAPLTNSKFTVYPSELGIKRLVEYQLGGDAEAHGVPR